MPTRKRRPVGRPPKSPETKAAKTLSPDEVAQTPEEKAAILKKIGKTQTQILYAGFDAGKQPKEIIDEAYEKYGLVIASPYAYSTRVRYNRERNLRAHATTFEALPPMLDPQQVHAVRQKLASQTTEDLFSTLFQMIQEHGEEKVSELMEMAIKLSKL